MYLHSVVPKGIGAETELSAKTLSLGHSAKENMDPCMAKMDRGRKGETGESKRNNKQCAHQETNENRGTTTLGAYADQDKRENPSPIR